MCVVDAWAFKIILISAVFITTALLMAFVMYDKPNKFSIVLSIALAICGFAIWLDVVLMSTPFILNGKQYDTAKIVEDNNLKIKHKAYYEKLNTESWVLKAEHKGYLSENGIEPGVVYVIEWQSGYGKKIIKAFVYEDEDSAPDPHVNDYQNYKYEDNTVSGNN